MNVEFVYVGLIDSCVDVHLMLFFQSFREKAVYSDLFGNVVTNQYSSAGRSRFVVTKIVSWRPAPHRNLHEMKADSVEEFLNTDLFICYFQGGDRGKK